MQRWKVEKRTTCKECAQPITGARFRSFCSTPCRNKYHARKDYYKHNRNEEQREASGKYIAGKIQCLICARWYFKPGAHVVMRHGLTAREYREHFELEVKRGITPDFLRKAWGDTARANGTVSNLQAGAKYRFKKGQEGIGVYERSPVTLARLKDLHKMTAVYKKSILKK